jgi:hypothetical protein
MIRFRESVTAGTQAKRLNPVQLLARDSLPVQAITVLCVEPQLYLGEFATVIHFEKNLT